MIKKGFSLALTLWIVAIMSLASVLYLSYAKKVVQKTKLLNQKLQLTFDTESTIELLKFYIATGYFEKYNIKNNTINSVFPSLPNTLLIDGTKESFDNRIVILQDSAGLININDTDAIANYFTQSNDIEHKGIIIDSIKDWLDLDEFALLNGAESLYYRNKKYAYIPRNELYFASTDEIFLLRGLVGCNLTKEQQNYNNLIVSDLTSRNLLTMDMNLLQKIYGFTQNEIEQLKDAKKEDINLFLSMFYRFNAQNMNWERDSSFPSNILKMRVLSSNKNIKKDIILIINFRLSQEYVFEILEYND